LTAAALMAAWLVVLSGPAMAQNIDFDNDNGFFDNDNDNDNDDFDNFFFDRDNDSFNGGFDNAFDIEQETDETGDVTLDTSIVNTGNNSNQCVAPLQFGNTGNLQNAQGFSSFGSSSNDGLDNDFNNDFFDFNNDFNNDFNTNVDDVEFEGSSFEFNPEQNVQCDQAVQQSAAASG
jgi:hypothetical protein